MAIGAPGAIIGYNDESRSRYNNNHSADRKAWADRHEWHCNWGRWQQARSHGTWRAESAAVLIVRHVCNLRRFGGPGDD